MPHRCPWYMGYALLSPLRRWHQDPARILPPHVRPGFTVLEPGPGMGFFTLELARLVGSSGKVHAVDVEPRMLSALKRRARAAGLDERIETRLAPEDGLGIADLADSVDFVLAFAMVHELPSAAGFFAEAAAAMKTGASMLLAEPLAHVGAGAFDAECGAAADAGLSGIEWPSIAESRAVVLAKV